MGEKSKGPPFGAHALIAPALANCFQMLGVGGAVFDRKRWLLMHAVLSVKELELQHGVEHERDLYNHEKTELAWKSQQPVLGRHAGHADWFVPIVALGRTRGVLIVGPFETARLSADDLLERWRRLTGRQGHPSDPEFSHYVSMSLSTLVLEGEQVGKLERILRCLARLMAGEGRAETELEQAAALRDSLEKETRGVERAWDAACGMVDESTSLRWASPNEAEELAWLGLSRFPKQVLVGLTVDGQSADPVARLVHRDAFQRACVALARKKGEMVAGPIGDHGVMFLSSAPGSDERRRRRLLEIGTGATALARRDGLSLHLGMSRMGSATPLPEQYRDALGAAEHALSEGVGIARGVPVAHRPGVFLDELARQLSQLLDEKPASLPARFDRYIEVISQHDGHRLDPVRAHLEAGFARIAEAARERSVVDARSLSVLYETLERSAREARTVHDLSSAYRAAVTDIAEAAERPLAARRDHGLSRAAAYIHRHYAEPLRLGAVARVAGFAPNYFSLLFKRREKMTFERYLRQVRVERAKQLLATTDLTMQRVAQLSGFGSRIYLAQVFRTSFAVTPFGYRRRSRAAR
jgi:AraC-like DNA-binding protein